MRSLSFKSRNHVELVDAPIPEPTSHEALIRIEASAICGSELKAPPGSNPGHEAVGIIEHVPPGSDFAVAERVGISAVDGCGVCAHCQQGVQIYCQNRVPATGYQGMHADYVAVAPSALRRIPQGIPPETAVLLVGDTLGVPVRAMRRVSSSNGDRILVVGLGPVGLSHTLVRAHAGAEVIGIDPCLYRRELALKLGAVDALPPGVDIGDPPRLVIESTGREETIHVALELVASGGTVLQSGECPMIQMSPSEEIIRREITWVGSWYYAVEDYPEMVRLYEDGLRLGELVTHIYPADEITTAYEQFVSRESGKVVLRWS